MYRATFNVTKKHHATPRSLEATETRGDVTAGDEETGTGITALGAPTWCSAPVSRLESQSIVCIYPERVSQQSLGSPRMRRTPGQEPKSIEPQRGSTRLCATKRTSVKAFPTVTLHRHPDNHTHCNCGTPLGFGSINWQPGVRRDRRPQAWLWNRVAVKTFGSWSIQSQTYRSSIGTPYFAQRRRNSS
jgi:hypothetical protein